MSKLSVIDTAFLALETAASPKHVAGLAVFEPSSEADPTDLRELLDRMKRTPAAPPFNQKLHTSIFSMPRWVEDPDVDLDWHVRHLRLPAPGSTDQLMEVVSQLHATVLDRSRPLWEFYLIEGLEGGQFATYVKVHHAYMDGLSMSRRVCGTLNESGQDASVTPVWAMKSGGHTDTPPARNLPAQLMDGLKGTRTLLQSIPTFGSLALDHGTTALGLRKGILPVPFSAPRTRLNAVVTPARSAAIMKLDFARIKNVAASAGVKINDVFLSICDGALGAYLDRCGQTPDRPLIVQMPLSLRRAGEGHAGNQITVALVELPGAVGDPVQRLRAVSYQTARVKHEYGRMSEFAASTYTVFLQSLAQVSEVVKANRIIPPLGNILISNVAGPTTALHLNHSKLVGLYPISTIPPGVSANITFFTTGEMACAGIVAGREAIPETRYVAEQMVQHFESLEAALQIKRYGGKRRKKKRATA